LGKNITNTRFGFHQLPNKLLKLQNAKLPKIKIVNCEAKEVNFTETNLSEGIFTNTDFDSSVFFKTNLTKSDFRGAKNYNIDMRYNTLQKTHFSSPEVLSLLNSLDIVID